VHFPLITFFLSCIVNSVTNNHCACNFAAGKNSQAQSATWMDTAKGMQNNYVIGINAIQPPYVVVQGLMIALDVLMVFYIFCMIKISCGTMRGLCVVSLDHQTTII
jgi:hypothetical protein